MRYNFKIFVFLIFIFSMAFCEKNSETVELLPLKEGDGYHYFDSKGTKKSLKNSAMLAFLRKIWQL